MLEIWSIEIARGIGRLFMNPLLYWGLFLFIWIGYKRIKRERKQFGTKVFNLFAEGHKMLFISIFFGIIISFLAVFSGIIMSFETILVLIVVTMLLSITASTTFLSATYTLGITFILLILLPFLNLEAVSIDVNFGDISIVHLISIAILTGIFLLVESVFIRLKSNRPTFPLMTLSQRGIWVGQHQVKGLTIIPFLTFLPSENISVIAPILPYFHYGEQSFSLVLIPFILGFNYHVQGELPSIAARRIGQATFLLSLLVLLCAFASLYFSLFAFIAIVLAIIGKEWITYRHKMNDRKRPAFFVPLDKGVKVLAMIPNSSADRLGIQVGETILKVNGATVINSAQFYEALQNSGAFFKLDVLDDNGEVRFINSAFYEEDHHELGIIFAEEPHHSAEKILTKY